jgi:hypothetical protein
MIIKGTHSGVTRPVKGEAPGGGLAEVPIPNQSFGYLALAVARPDPAALLPNTNPTAVIQALTALGTAMVDEPTATNSNSTIPVVYTYWGQFIDHDITAGTDRADTAAPSIWHADIFADNFTPVDPARVIGDQGIFNQRLPQLDLDCIYGGKPDDEAVITEGIFEEDEVHVKVGVNPILSGFEKLTPNPHLDTNRQKPQRDLPRHHQNFNGHLLPAKAKRMPIIGDDRNDENTIVAQFHTALLKFHNAVVDWLTEQDGALPSFTKARNLVRWHYQWLVVNDFLRTICKEGVVDQVLYSEDSFFASDDKLFMPLEFSVAGFRFGHTMIREGYDFNMNFGRGSNPQEQRASLARLFQFTGLKGDLGGFFNLPNNWIIDWERLTDKYSPHPDRFARKIDTDLADSLNAVPGDSMAAPSSSAIAKHLAIRNLRRGYLLSIPTGQAVADFLGIDQLSPDDLIPSDRLLVKSALELEDGLFTRKTPLWYYILREAELQTNGNALGEVGSQLVAGTLIGLLKHDPGSYLRVEDGWSPAKGVKLNGKPIVRILDLFKFAGVA